MANDQSKMKPEGNGTERATAGFYPTLDRFSAFSDGVFAIAITLLVLELPKPPETVPLVPALLEAWPDFLGYIMSFAFIGGIWLTHSGLTRFMKSGGALANAANLLLLLFVALLPFTTSVIGHASVQSGHWPCCAPVRHQRSPGIPDAQPSHPLHCPRSVAGG